MAKTRRRFTQAEDEKLIELARNHSIDEIARRMERHPGSIQSACRRLNISTSGGTGGFRAHKQRRPKSDLIG
ncbi:MAG: hypothetical protein AB7H90_03410 [Alphaproteobacteria bacterium]